MKITVTGIGYVTVITSKPSSTPRMTSESGSASTKPVGPTTLGMKTPAMAYALAA